MALEATPRQPMEARHIIMDKIKEIAALTALNDMMAKGWFDICVINKVADLIDVNPSGDAYRILAVLHCIHYDKMPADLRDSIPDLVQQCLGIAPIFQFKTLNQKVIDVTPERRSEKRRWLRLPR